MKMKKTIAAIAALTMLATSIGAIAVSADCSYNTDDGTGTHDWVAGDKTGATCTADGTQKYNCNCGETKEETITATGHSYAEVADTAQEPTCTEAGKKADQKCSNCDATVTGEAIAATGHSYEDVADSAKEPTCTEAGKKADQKCSVCNDIVTGEAIAATGHNYVDGTCACGATESTENPECEHVDVKGAKDDEGNDIGDGICDNCGKAMPSGDDNNNDDNNNNDDSESGSTGGSTGSDTNTNTGSSSDNSSSSSSSSSSSNSSGALTSIAPANSAVDNTVSSAKFAAAAAKVGTSNFYFNAEETGVTAEIIEAFAGNSRAKTMTAKLDNIKVTIDKNDIADISELEDLDFSLTGKDVLTKKQIKDSKLLNEAKMIVQLDFAGDSINGLNEVTIKAKASLKMCGKKAVVYEFVDGKIVKVCDSKVDARGYVAFDTDHLGQFIIAVM